MLGTERTSLRAHLRETTRGVRGPRRRGLHKGGNRRWSLRFGTATHVARRAVPGVLRNFLGSFAAATFTWPNRRVELRESDGREIGRRRIRRGHGSSSERLITLGRRRWLGASRVAVIERGQRRQPRAEEDRELMRVCPCVEKRTAEVGENRVSASLMRVHASSPNRDRIDAGRG